MSIALKPKDRATHKVTLQRIPDYLRGILGVVPSQRLILLECLTLESANAGIVMSGVFLYLQENTDLDLSHLEA